MSSQPPTPAAASVAPVLPISQAPSFAHVVADQGICSFLGVDFDLSFLASSQKLVSMPVIETGSAGNVEAQNELIESVRVRLNTNAARHVALNILYSLLISNQMSIDAVRSEIEKMAAQVPSAETVVQ